MGHCCIFCSYKSMGSTLHTFPNPNKYLENCQKWIKIAGKYALNSRVRKEFATPGPHQANLWSKYKVCDRHFKPEHKNRFKRICPINAVPIYHIPGWPESERLTSMLEATIKQGNVQASETDREMPTVSEPNLDHTYFSSKPVVSGPTTDKIKSQTLKKVEKIPTEAVARPLQKIYTKSPVFSWDRPGATLWDILPEDILDSKLDVLLKLDNFSHHHSDLSMYDDDTHGDSPEYLETNIENYVCNYCKEAIDKDYRYTCVQCSDYDLCCKCERDGIHSLHFMLRVPDHKPLALVAAILEGIRQKLHSMQTNLPAGSWENPTIEMDIASGATLGRKGPQNLRNIGLKHKGTPFIKLEGQNQIPFLAPEPRNIGQKPDGSHRPQFKRAPRSNSEKASFIQLVDTNELRRIKKERPSLDSMTTLDLPLNDVKSETYTITFNEDNINTATNQDDTYLKRQLNNKHSPVTNKSIDYKDIIRNRSPVKKYTLNLVQDTFCMGNNMIIDIGKKEQNMWKYKHLKFMSKYKAQVRLKRLGQHEFLHKGVIKEGPVPVHRYIRTT